MNFRRGVVVRIEHGKMVALFSAMAVLGSCSFVPDYQRPDPGSPTAFRQSASELPRPRKEWWRDFASPELDALIEKGLANNHDLKAALHRVAQAEAQATSSRSGLFPLISGYVQHERFGPEGGAGAAVRYNTDWKTSKLTQGGLRMSYELDLWGKNRAAAESAEELVLATEHDRRTVALSLIGDIVTSYFQYLLALEQMVVAEDSRQSVRRQLSAVEQRAKVGEATQIEVMQQRTAVAQADSRIPADGQMSDQALHRLAVLTGAPPGTLRLEGDKLRVIAVPPVAAGLPSEMLQSRPDIARAEAQLRSANADIGVARAKFLPSFSLTGDGGTASPTLASLLSPAALYLTLLGSLTQTIFDAGRTAAEVDFNEARFKELAETYQSTVLIALREVEDALSSSRRLAEQEASHKELVAIAKEAHELSTLSYNAGHLEYLTLLETERARYQAADNALQIRFSRLAAAINLYKALGGMELPAAAGSKGAS